jgi:signal transduction histidine kinase
VNDLLNFTGDRDPHWQTFSLRDAVEEVLQSVRPQLDAQGIEIDVDVPQFLSVKADFNMLRRAILNLVLNAIDAMPSGGEIVITGCNGHKGIELEIADSGPGLNEDVRRRAFEPFYSTKSSGTGLGLAIVHRIAEVHGGAARCSNCPEGGAAFTLQFPHQRALEAAA